MTTQPKQLTPRWLVYATDGTTTNAVVYHTEAIALNAALWLSREGVKVCFMREETRNYFKPCPQPYIGQYTETPR